MKIEEASFYYNAVKSQIISDTSPRILDNYSGRGMIGKTTVGVIIPNFNMLLPAVLQYARENKLKWSDLPDTKTIRHDNMGNNTVIY